MTSGRAESRWRLPPVRGLLTLVAGEGVSRVLSFLAIAILTRRMNPAAWGPVAVALTTLQFGSLIVELGMRLFGAREVARRPADAHRLMGPILATQVVVAALLVVLATLVARLHVVEADLGRLLPGYSVSLLAFPFVLAWIYQGLGAMQWVAIPQVTRYAAFLLLTALLVRSAADVPRLPWLEVAALSSAAAVSVSALRRFGLRLSVTPRKAFDRAILREALPISASELIWVVRMYLPTLALWYVVSPASVGRFDVSHRVLMVLHGLLTMYLINLYTPLSQAAHGPQRRFVGLLAGSAAFATTAATLGAIVIAVRPAMLLNVLFGAQFSTPEGAATLVILASLIPVLTLRGHAMYALVALGRQRRELACSIAGSVVLAVLLWRWVPAWGVRGAAFAMLGSESFALLLTVVALVDALRRPAPIARDSEVVAIS